ncbi:MAG: D-alanine--D-alanine ligase [Pseudomonadales bacterium]|nr:D-alanine--D-alanine ligase [Pseudomonadales bacterium]
MTKISPLSQEERSRLVAKAGRVALFFGGQSAERAVSLNSGQAVAAALERLEIEHLMIDTGDVFPGPEVLKDVDRVFLALHGRGGEDGTIQGYLESLQIPYTGSGVMASALAMDKVRTKQLWRGLELPTPDFCVLSESEDWVSVMQRLGPVICVKPAHEGSSIGVQKVKSVAELQAAFMASAALDTEVIAETWVEGPEYTVGILSEGALPVIGLSTDHVFYDYDAKYLSDDTRYLLPSGLSQEEELALQQLSLDAFNAVGCKGWGRVDVMRDQDGRFWLLEVNTIPGMTDHSLTPMAAQAAGVDFNELVLRILTSSYT